VNLYSLLVTVSTYSEISCTSFVE